MTKICQEIKSPVFSLLLRLAYQLIYLTLMDCGSSWALAVKGPSFLKSTYVYFTEFPSLPHNEGHNIGKQHNKVFFKTNYPRSGKNKCNVGGCLFVHQKEREILYRVTRSFVFPSEANKSKRNKPSSFME